MHYSRKTPCFAATMLLLTSNIAQAQGATSSCVDTDFDTVNATGSVQVAGFQPFISRPPVQNSTWTISTAIKEVQSFDANSSVIEQTFWLDTDPLGTTSATDLPYSGCAILLTGFSSPRTSTGTNDSNTCDGVFDTACYNAILIAVSIFELENSVSSIANVCQTILATPPSQCNGYAWSGVFSTRKVFPAPVQTLSFHSLTPTAIHANVPLPPPEPFGNPDFFDNGNTSCSPSIFNGSATHGAIVGQESSLSSPLTNYTTYDAWVRRATPLILTAFTKNITKQTPRWADTRLVCLTAKDVTSGSRVPVSNGGRNSGGRREMVLAVGVSGLAAAMGLLW